MPYSKFNPLFVVLILWATLISGCKGFDSPGEVVSPSTSSSEQFAFSAIEDRNSIAATATAKLPSKRFKIVWLEPHSINQSVTNRNKQPGKEEIRKIFTRYKQMGVETVVTAYSMYLNYYFYEPSELLKQNYPQANTLHLLDDGTVFLDAVFEAAEAAGIDLIIGLSPFGDKEVVSRLTADMIAARSAGVADASQIFSSSNTAELNKQIILNNMMANDIYYKYGSSQYFRGFYLVIEPHCLDVAMNYFGPISNFIKSLDPDLDIMISPNADAEACFSSTSALQQQQIDNLHLQLLKMKQDGISIIAYQDSIGAGFEPGMGQFRSYVGPLYDLLASIFPSYAGTYYFTDSARQRRMDYLEDTGLHILRAAHQNSGVDFWVNTELWRMDGYCLGQSNYYGCNYASATFQEQLDRWSQFTDQLMLNEGFMQFNFPEADIALSNTGNLTGKLAREVTEAFTASYLSYLGLEL